ncbi:MAG TPA: ABC transporter permease [Gemmatimonadales bacterium]
MSRRDDDLREEIAAHLEMAAAERRARGETARDAAQQAEREFGNVGLVQEITREMWGGQWIERLVQDVKIGVRVLARSPGFTVLVVLCLTLGIGANAAVYSWIEGILLRPYPGVRDQDRMVQIAGANRGQAGHTALSWPDFKDYREGATLFDAIATDKITGAVFGNGDRAVRLTGQIVSANYFDAIGVRPVMGRGFIPEEEVGRNAHPVVVIGYRMWRDRFKADPQIVGKTQMMNGVEHTIVGVTPEEFNGTFVGYAMQFWVPASMEETFDLNGAGLDDRGAQWVESFGRLRPGVTQAAGEQELQAIARRLEARYPETNKGRSIQLYPLYKAPFNAAGELFPTLRIGAVVAFFVLLIACANVSNLLLVRSLARRQEFTVRMAIGAGRARLVRQLATEGLILTSVAGVSGLLLAHWGRDLITVIIPVRSSSVNLPAALDWRVLALSAAVCALTTLLFAIIPVVQAGRIDLAGAMKAESGGVVGGSGRSRMRSGLVVLQVALSFVLLVGAGLLVKSLQGMSTADPGFSPDALISVLDLNQTGYDAPKRDIFRQALLERVQALPGVQSAAYGRVPPFAYLPYSEAPLAVEGYHAAADEQPSINYDEISPGYFATLGVPLVAGRDFARTDDAASRPVAIVNETMAARYWPGENPLGRYLQLKGRRLEVVGIVKTTRYRSLLEAPLPLYYVPLRQYPASLVVLFMRTPTGTSSMATMLTGAVHALDPGLPAAGVITMRAQIDRQSGSQRVALSLVTGFGGLALLLAVVGLYGVMSYAVSQGTRELGLRIALGAAARDLLRLVLSSGFGLVAIGAVLGGATALGTTRLLGALLYQVSPRDPLVFALAVVVLGVAGLAACLVPAWRAARTDPVRALRSA